MEIKIVLNWQNKTYTLNHKISVKPHALMNNLNAVTNNLNSKIESIVLQELNENGTIPARIHVNIECGYAVYQDTFTCPTALSESFHGELQRKLFGFGLTLKKAMLLDVACSHEFQSLKVSNQAKVRV